MPIKGSLREAGLADVCQLLAIGQKTGCLSVTDRSRFGQIYFDRGRITFATIVNRRDRIGDLLVREGLIDHAELMRAVDAQSEQPDRRLGEILLELGSVERDTLTRLIEHQIEEAIFYLFTWKRGNFHFEVGKEPDSRELRISVNPESLLLEGARRVDEWSVIEQKITSMDLIFGVDRSRIEATSAELSPQQAEVARLLDGQRTVDDVATGSGLGEFETGKAIFALLQAGFAYKAGRRAEQSVPDPGDVQEARNLGAAFYQTDMLDDAEREFRRVLDRDPHDRTARRFLALIALREGRTADAVRRLTALLESGGPTVPAYLNLAYALRVQKRFGDALRVLADARELAPDDRRIALAEAATRLFGGELEGAGKALQRYRGLLGPDGLPPPPYYYCAGLLALLQGRTDDADALVEEGLGVDPASPPLLVLAGNLAERRADAAAAQRSYQQAAEEDPSLPQAHRNLGDLALRRGLHDQALEHYRRAAELAPDLGDELHTRLADLYYRRGDREDAIRCWQRAVSLNPGNETARNRLEVVARATR